jgi:4-aminobutyrate aminotransferase-like enzyme
VAARAALAVLEVLEDEGLPARAAAVGERLRAGIAGLASDEILDVRGSGLLAGLQLRDAGRASRAVDVLREEGFLVGRTGRADDVLKIRPPLVFGDEHAELLVRALDRALR